MPLRSPWWLLGPAAASWQGVGQTERARRRRPSVVSLVAPGACCGLLAGGRTDRTGPAADAPAVSLAAPWSCFGLLTGSRAGRTGPAADAPAVSLAAPGHPGSKISFDLVSTASGRNDLQRTQKS